jgi:hypothetical protein
MELFNYSAMEARFPSIVGKKKELHRYHHAGEELNRADFSFSRAP